jgi:hypothetical protein
MRYQDTQFADGDLNRTGTEKFVGMLPASGNAGTVAMVNAAPCYHHHSLNAARPCADDSDRGSARNEELDSGVGGTWRPG